MTGIYKITDLTNNKIYIGQSTDIKNRWHYYHYPPNNTSKITQRIVLEIIHKGYNNFKFEVVEECLPEQLSKREQYWINYYDSYNTGYNDTPGGESCYGENNANVKLSEKDVRLIRKIYSEKTSLTKQEIYNTYFSNKITFRGFEKVWSGETWPHIMPEVYSEENKEYYKTTAKIHNGSENPNALLSDEEVIKIRKRYVNETGKQIYEDYKHTYSSYSSFEKVLLGRTYSNLPIYKKSKKEWINL